MSAEKIEIARQSTLEQVLNILETGSVFGFIEHCATLSPSERIEYIGANKNYNPISITMGGGYSLGDWADFPWLKANKPWMVKSDGTPDYRLKETDYTKKEADDTASDVANTSYAGGAFAWCMKIYKKTYLAGTDRYVMFSFEKQDGFEPVGFIDTSNNELEGVWIPMFYGSIVSSTMKSISGVQPEYNNATAAQKTAIDAFGSRAKFFGGPIISTLVDLMIMFAKNTDLQTFYGKGNSSGYDASLTPTMGVKANAVVDGGQFYGTSDAKSLNKIFHSIVLGTYQQWMRDPYTICVSGKLKVSKNYAYALDASGYTDAGIDYTGLTSGTWYYPNEFRPIPGFGEAGVAPFKGSSALGGCDGLIVNPSITAVGLRFGGCYNGLSDGPRALDLAATATTADWSVGSAILLLPPVGVAA